jgi:hypothetical protein
MLFADMIPVDLSTLVTWIKLTRYKLAIDRLRHRGCRIQFNAGQNVVLFIHYSPTSFILYSLFCT